VHPQTSDVELRLSELQTQIDGLNLALQQWRQIQEHAQPTEQRLAQLTVQCAEILNRWTATDERHTDALAAIEARLEDWGAIERRLQHDSRERIRELEQTIEHEWQALRRMHEEPVKQLREQAATLGETCVAAANLALRGFERAEVRLAALEQDLQARLNDLSRYLQAAIAEIRSAGGQRPLSLAEGVSPFPLESVMRIHDGLRRSAETDDSATSRLSTSRDPAAPSRTVRQLPEAAAALDERVQSLERAVDEAKATAERTEGLRRTTFVAAGALIVGLIVMGGLFVRAQQRTEARMNETIARTAAEAERQATKAANDAAEKRIAATRAEASRQVVEAQQAARQAQIVTSVLAAPDVLRFNLSSVDASSRATAQVLLSRSRGLVASASRLAPATVGGVYQLWLLANTSPVSVGVLTPDAAGRVTFVADVPANLPRPVIGATVTLESGGVHTSPTGATVLARTQ
jgi:Anti-sigma-K factor rskA, C-terminal